SKQKPADVKISLSSINKPMDEGAKGPVKFSTTIIKKAAIPGGKPITPDDQQKIKYLIQYLRNENRSETEGISRLEGSFSKTTSMVHSDANKVIEEFEKKPEDPDNVHVAMNTILTIFRKGNLFSEPAKDHLRNAEKFIKESNLDLGKEFLK